MAQIVTLYSGSSGNSTLIRDGGGSVLVDMGCSCKKTVAALYAAGLSASDVEAVLVTHEHSDHISGLLTFLRYYPVPVYGPRASLDYLCRTGLVPESAQLITTDGLGVFQVGGMEIKAFRTSHDSLDCVGYHFDFASGRRAAIATDLGYLSDDVYAELNGCDFVGLESNYDEVMLERGNYPYYLKSRIRSRRGHLCNNECAAAAATLAQAGTTRMVLMHLSQENNEPEIAQMTCLSMLENHGIGEDSIEITVAPRHMVGEPIEV